MSLGVWQATIVDDAGNVLPSAQINVYTANADGSNGSRPSLFSGPEGNTGLANPFNADSEGFARFYTESDLVNVVATGGGSSRTWRRQLIAGTAATRDVTASDTDTTADRVLRVGAGQEQLDPNLYHRGNILGTVGLTGSYTFDSNTGEPTSTPTPTGAIIERGSNSDGEYVKFADGTMICTKKTESIATRSSNNRFISSWTFPSVFMDTPVIQCIAGISSSDYTDVSNTQILSPIHNTGITSGSASSSTLGFNYSGSAPTSASITLSSITGTGRWF